MKKILLALLLCGSSAMTCFAQSNHNGIFSIGAEGGLPVGNYSDLYKFGIGASLKYDYPIQKNTYVTFSAGYINYSIKDDAKALLRFFGSDQSSSGFVPIKVGAKYYFNDAFFGEAQVGAAITTSSGGGTAFAYSPGIGYTHQKIEFGIRYEAWSKNGTFGQFGLRLAYRF